MTASQFDLLIKCDVKVITRQAPSTSWKIQIGAFTTQAFDFGKIQFDPDCPKFDTNTSLKYDATFGGAPLPPYI